MDETEKVGLEHGADGFVLAFLDGGEISVSCVVDEDVNLSEAIFSCLHGSGDLLLVGDVEREGKGVGLATGDKLSKLPGLAGGDDGVPSAVEDELSELLAEACRASGDEPHGGLLLFHVESSSARLDDGLARGGLRRHSCPLRVARIWCIFPIGVLEGQAVMGRFLPDKMTLLDLVRFHGNRKNVLVNHPGGKPHQMR